MRVDVMEKYNVLKSNLMLLDSISRRKSYSKLFPEAPMMAEETEELLLKIENRIKEILADERLSYKSATIFGNAPLALIQLSMEVELHTLQKVIGQPLTDIRKLRNES